ncbi:MAG: molybdopterin-dependent oxidoreductase [Anaerolineales bacterium]
MVPFEMRKLAGVIVLLGMAAACGPLSPSGSVAPGQPSAQGQASLPPPPAIASALPPLPQPTPAVVPLRGALVGSACQLPPIIAPTSAPTPQSFDEYDPTTGLHVTGGGPTVDLATYRLTVTGRVDHPLSLTYDELRCLPKVGVHCELVCPGVFVDNASWAGAPFESVLDLAGVQSGAQSIVLVGADGYSTLVDLNLVKSSDAFLAYELNGGVLPVLHGFPVRAVFPGVEGSQWAKWVVRIEVH